MPFKKDGRVDLPKASRQGGSMLIAALLSDSDKDAAGHEA